MVTQQASQVAGQAREATVSVAEASAVRFAKRVFTSAAIYGLLVMLPQYFLEEQNGLRNPPAITHPEYYYGFIGVVIAWQVLFLILAQNPIRYRPMMLPAILEKAGFGIAAVVLFLLGRLSLEMLGAGIIDLILLTLFTVSYIRTAPHRIDTTAEQR
jgi:hypothetical protein